MNNLIDTIIKIVTLLIASAAVIIIVLLATQRVDRYLDYVGIQDCATAYRLEYNDTANNTTIIRPVDDLYQACLDQKGIR